jgi:hypothetical protein
MDEEHKGMFGGDAARFATTCWSAVLAAGRESSEPQHARGKILARGHGVRVLGIGRFRRLKPGLRTLSCPARAA